MFVSETHTQVFLLLPQNAQRSSNSNSFQFYSVSPKIPPRVLHAAHLSTSTLYMSISRRGSCHMPHWQWAVHGKSVMVSAAAQMRQVCCLATHAGLNPLVPASQVNVGPTHNIFLSSYIDYTTGSAQYNWLLNDLQSIDRSKTPW